MTRNVAHDIVQAVLANKAGECAGVLRCTGILPVYCDRGADHMDPKHRGYAEDLREDVQWLDGWGELS